MGTKPVRDSKVTRSVRLAPARWAVVDAVRAERELKSDGETIDIILTQWEAYRAAFLPIARVSGR